MLKGRSLKAAWACQNGAGSISESQCSCAKGGLQALEVCQSYPPGQRGRCAPEGACQGSE